MKSKLLILVFFIVSVIIVFNRQEPDHNNFTGDRCGYYMYLPAIFIYNDLSHLSFYKKIETTYTSNLGIECCLHDVNEKKLDKYAVGMALMQSPLFLIANAYCKTSDNYPADGFSKPYQLAGIFSGILFTTLGLFVLRRFLRRYFTDEITAITLLCIAFGTNLYVYTAFEGQMSHACSFFLFSCLISLTHTWYAKPPGKYASVLLGLTIGFIFIVRPINIIACIIPLVWKINSVTSAKERMHYWGKYIALVLLVLICSFLIALIQFSYLKYITGQWFYYSYQGEHFDFLHSHFINGLFSFKRGWFVYTPMTLVGIAGFYFLWKADKKAVPALLIFFVVMIYSVFSWEQWWYGESFSCRPLVEAIAFLSLPLAAISRYFYETKVKLKKVAYFAVILFFVTLNMFQSYQYSRWMFDDSKMTGAYYWKIFGKY